jgi:hypothetical protein
VEIGLDKDTKVSLAVAKSTRTSPELLDTHRAWFGKVIEAVALNSNTAAATLTNLADCKYENGRFAVTQRIGVPE